MPPPPRFLELFKEAVQAVDSQDNEKLAFLLDSLDEKSQADLVNLNDAQGETLMIKALRQKFPNAKTVEIIRSVKGLNTEIRDKRLKLTPLFFAYMTGKKEIFEQFLNDKRVNLNARDSLGETILIREVLRGSAAFPNEEIVMQIANHPRVNITQTDFSGKDAIDYAKEKEATTGRTYYAVAVKLEEAKIKQQIARALEPLLKEQKYLRRKIARLTHVNLLIRKKICANNEKQQA